MKQQHEIAWNAGKNLRLKFSQRKLHEKVKLERNFQNQMINWEVLTMQTHKRCLETITRTIIAMYYPRQKLIINSMALHLYNVQMPFLLEFWFAVEPSSLFNATHFNSRRNFCSRLYRNLISNSCHRFSIGFMAVSGLIDGHGSSVTWFLWSQGDVALNLPFGSLSCWKDNSPCTPSTSWSMPKI